MQHETIGCLPATLRYKAGHAVVQVMPRKLANIVATKRGVPLDGGHGVYPESADRALAQSGYLATVVEATENGAAGPVYALRPLRGPSGTSYLISGHFVFGPAYAIGDVVEVQDGVPGRPPHRRIFIGYAFDFEFEPGVQAYGEDDSLSILEDANTAVVDLEDAELWKQVSPERCLVVDAPPRFRVEAFRGDTRIDPSIIPEADWLRLRTR